MTTNAITETAAANVYWERHMPSCTGFSSTGKRCSKCNGPRNMAQRNVYALEVMLVMTGGAYECPCCARPWDGFFDVDRTTPEAGYKPGVIVYICRACNADRGVLQGRGDDIVNVDAYRADVLAASASVVPLTPADAVRAWAARSVPVESPRVNRYNVG